MRTIRPVWPAVLVVASLGAIGDRAEAIEGRLGLHGVRLEPNGPAEDLGRASWGGGLEGTFGIPGSWKMLAVDAGFEFVVFDTRELRSQPDPFSFERTLSTSQTLVRLYAGLLFGPHGRGFLQPYVGVHGSVADHSLSTTLAERYDNPDLDRTQTTSEDDWGVGYDVTAGLHLNVLNRFGAYGGVRYLHIFGVNRPLGDRAVTLDPEYLEVYVGLSMDLGYLDRISDSD